MQSLTRKYPPPPLHSPWEGQLQRKAWIPGSVSETKWWVEGCQNMRVKQDIHRVACFSSQYGLTGPDRNTAATENPAYPLVRPFCLRTYGPWWDLAPSSPAPISKSKKNSVSVDSKDFIDVQFADYVFPERIILDYYNNPYDCFSGALVRILALESGSPTPNFKRWTTIWSAAPGPSKHRQADSLPLKATKNPTNLLRLELNQSHLGYFTELDGVTLYGKQACNCGELWEKSKSKAAVKKKGDISTANLFRELVASRTQKTENGCFDILPSELMHYIFTFFDLRELAKISPTCRLFFLHCYDPVWYKELDLKPYWSQMTNETLNSFHTRCTSTEKLDLSWSGPYGAVTAQGMCRFLEHCGSNLVCLRLSCCQFVDREVIEALSQYCPKLEELDLQSCVSQSLSEDGLWSLAELEKLRRLNLYRVPVSNHSMTILSSFCNLQHLNLGDCESLTDCDQLMEILGICCSGLVSLDLWRNNSLTDVGIYSLADGCPLLEELDIGWCSCVTRAECIVYLTSKCRKLKKLFLTAVRCVNDNVINAIADNSPDMEQVDVLGARQVHDYSITRLLEHCKKMKYLDVTFCWNFGDESVHHLRSVYPEVTIKREESSPAGRANFYL